MKKQQSKLIPGYISPELEILGADLDGLLCVSAAGGSFTDFEGENQFIVFEGQGV